MPEERLDGKDLRVLLLWIVVGLAGAGFAYKYFFRAFPEAAVDFRVSRAAALEEARKFLTARGQKLAGYESSIIFDVDDDAKTYLERELGLEQANRLMAAEISVWYWDARFFRPGQKEEFHVRVSPAGRVVGFSRVLEEERPGASLVKDAARALAENYLRTASGLDASAYEYLPEEANTSERPKRRDWSFTWERRGFKAKDAPYRLHITVLGNEVGGSEEFLKVPEAWKDNFKRLRSSNLLYQVFGEVPGYFLVGAMLVAIYQRARQSKVHWRGALKVGGVVAALFFAMEVNQWPLTRFGYDTKSSYSGFFLQEMALAALGAAALALLIAAAFAAGEPLYRMHQPGQLQLRRAFSLRGMRTKEFFRSSVIGLCMAGGSIGFVVLFYVAGQKLGVWAPQDIKYTNVASTALPWLSPLATSFLAASAEEFIFRLFAIPFLYRATRSWVAAIVLPAFIWGFGHSAYPVEPGYVRGIEVGLIGVVAGLVMLRYGILTTLVWHYTADATLIGLFLLRSESLYFKLSGAVVGAAVVFPLAFAGISYLARGRFEADESLLNRAEPETEALAVPGAAAQPVRGGYEALSARTIGILLACGVFGALLVLEVRPERIGDFLRFSVDARRAKTKADEVLRHLPGRNLNPADWRHAVATAFTFDGYVNEYLRRQAGVSGANRLYQEKVPSAFWRVRYFRDSQKEEYAVILQPDGALHSVHHELEEKAPGAHWSKEQAVARAEAYLREEKKLDLGRWKLVDAQSEKKQGRTDHTLVWEELAGIGDAHARIELTILGDEATAYSIFFKIPEEWRDRQKRGTLASTGHLIGSILFYVAVGGIGLIIFFKSLKQPAVAEIPWKRLALWSLWGLAAYAVLLANSTSALLMTYPTQFPLRTFQAIQGILLVFSVLAIYGLLVFVLGLAWFFLSRAFGSERLPTWRGMPGDYYRDAFLLGLAGTGAVLGLSRAFYFAARLWPTAKKTVEAGVAGHLDAALPATAALGGAILYGLFLVGLMGIAAGFLTTSVRQRSLQVGVIMALAVTLSGGWGSPADFAKSCLVHFVFLSVYAWGIARVVRFNLLGLFLLGVMPYLAVEAAELLQQPNAFFRANGYALAVAMAALLAWPLVSWQRSTRSGASFAHGGS